LEEKREAPKRFVKNVYKALIFLQNRLAVDYNHYNKNRECHERALLPFHSAPEQELTLVCLEQNQAQWNSAIERFNQQRDWVISRGETIYAELLAELHEDELYQFEQKDIREYLESEERRLLKAAKEARHFLKRERRAERLEAREFLKEQAKLTDAAEAKITNAQYELDCSAELTVCASVDKASATTKRVYAHSHFFNDRKAPRNENKDDATFGRKKTQKKRVSAGIFGSRNNIKNQLIKDELSLEGLKL
jgi:hypothetical protein